jgi:hypothetical protein
MRIREETPDAVFKGFCAIAFSLFVAEKKTILSYLLFGMGFGWLFFMVSETMGWIKVDRPSRGCRCKEVGTDVIGILPADPVAKPGSRYLER